MLVVDDDDEVRSVLVEGLVAAGFDTQEAATGGDALRLAQRRPAAIVLDVQLPDVDGVEVCRRIRASARTSSIPVLMVSGFMVADADRTAGLASGADLYLTKPVSPSGLGVAVDTLLRLRRAADEAHLGVAHARLLVSLLSGGVALAEVLRRVGEVASALLGADVARLRLVDPVTGELRLAASIGTTSREPDAARSGLSHAVLAGRRTIAIDDAFAAPVVTEKDRLAEEGVASLLATPLGVADEVIGVLTFWSRTRRAWTAEDVMRAETIAVHAAGAIRTARIVEQNERRRRVAESLDDVALLLSRSLDPVDVAGGIVESIRRLLSATAAGLYRVDAETGDLVLMARSQASTWVPRIPAGEGLNGLAIRDRRPVTSPAVTADARVRYSDDVRQRIVETGTRAALAVPLVARDHVIGTVCVADEADRRFTADDVAIAAAFANHATIAIENSRLFEEAERRRGIAESLAEVALLLSQSLDPAEVAARVAESVYRLVGARSAAVFRLDGARERLVLMNRAGPTEFLSVMGRHEGTSGLAVRERRPVVTSDAVTDDRILLSPGLRDTLLRSGERAVLAVPLIVRDRIIGGISVTDVQGRVFTPAEVALAEAFASHAAMAMENSRLFEDSERRRREAESLADVGRLVTQSLDVAEVGTRIVNSLHRLVRADTAALYVYDDATGMLHLACTTPGPTWKPTMRPGDGLSGFVVRERRSLVTPDVIEDPRLSVSEPIRSDLERLAVRAGLGVPLLAQDEVIGALVLLATTGRMFTDEDTALATAFASHAAIALQNSRLFAQRLRVTEQLAARARRQAALASLAQEAIAADDLDVFAGSAARIVADTLGVTHAGVFEQTPDAATFVMRAGVGWPADRDVTVPAVNGIGPLDRALVFDERARGESVVAPLLADAGIANGVESVIDGFIPPYGVLGAYTVDARPFSEADATFMRTAASVVGMALLRMRTETTLRRQAGRLRILHEIDQAILAARSAREIADAGLQHFVKLVPCWRASVTLFDVDDASAVVFAMIGAGDDFLPVGVRYPLTMVGPGAMTELSAGRVHRVPDAALEDAPPLVRQLAAHGMRGYFRVPLMVRGEPIGALNATFDRPHRFTEEDIQIAREIAEPLAVALEQARLHEDVLGSRAQLQALSRRMVEIQESERAHLARELHDEIGQLLTGLKLSLEAQARHPDDVTGDALTTARTHVTELMARVRALSLDLRPAALDDLGLVPALGALVQRYTSQTRVEVVLKERGVQGRRFPREVESTAYRIIQEALTNVARHAGVQTVTVRLWADAEQLGVQVEDEGAGFDARRRGPGAGLAGMRERAALLGARLDIATARGQGTCITAEFPLT